MPDIHAVTSDALQLAPVQRVELIESLLASFDSHRSEVDALWTDETERRIDAHEQDKLKAFSVDEVFNRMEHQSNRR